MRDLFTLPQREGGLGVTSLIHDAPQQFSGSTLITKPHVETIIEQSVTVPDTDSEGNTINGFKKLHLSSKSVSLKENLVNVDANLPTDLKSFVNQAREKGASSWLNAIPLKDQGLDRNKQEFKDALRL